MKKFNERVALWLSSYFATMACFWVFNALAFMPIIIPPSLPYVQFISSGWLQLIALPLLAVSGVVIGRRAEARAEQDHNALMELVHDLHAKHDSLLARVPARGMTQAQEDALRESFRRTLVRVIPTALRDLPPAPPRPEPSQPAKLP